MSQEMNPQAAIEGSQIRDPSELIMANSMVLRPGIVMAGLKRVNIWSANRVQLSEAAKINIFTNPRLNDRSHFTVRTSPQRMVGLGLSESGKRFPFGFSFRVCLVSLLTVPNSWFFPATLCCPEVST